MNIFNFTEEQESASRKIHSTSFQVVDEYSKFRDFLETHEIVRIETINRELDGVSYPIAIVFYYGE